MLIQPVRISLAGVYAWSQARIYSGKDDCLLHCTAWVDSTTWLTFKHGDDDSEFQRHSFLMISPHAPKDGIKLIPLVCGRCQSCVKRHPAHKAPCHHFRPMSIFGPYSGALASKIGHLCLQLGVPAEDLVVGEGAAC